MLVTAVTDTVSACKYSCTSLSCEHCCPFSPARQQRLALLCICHALVLDAAHTQHLWDETVELIKAAPAATRRCTLHKEGQRRGQVDSQLDSPISVGYAV